MANERGWRSTRLAFSALLGVLVLVAAVVGFTGSAASASAAKFTTAPAAGELDCNGFSSAQKVLKGTGACTDIKGIYGVSNSNTWDGRFYDNGHYIGHDEPDLTFLSNRPGSGNNVTWTETLPTDPSAAPTVSSPGSDVVHWFELSGAPWFSMALCNSQSYPLLPCTPNSDKNAPACINAFNCPANGYPGGGSSFLEVQFYPPGDAPFVDSISCDNSHWCASLHINDAECTLNFTSCNPACTEPTNFAFIQTNGVPTGPPNPQQADNATFTPNGQTLLMSPGDKLRVHIFDAPAPGGGHALEVAVDDLTSGQSGFMQASAANGYAQTQFADCSGQFFNYEPEYSTAGRNEIVPWAALETNISTEYEIGHATPCQSVTGLVGFGAGGAGDPVFSSCVGPYETASDASTAEGTFGDAPCWTNGDTHGTLNSDPNEVALCLNFASGGDIDFDGTSYWPDWPTGTTPTATTAGSFMQNAPTSAGQTYSQSFFQTDTALSEPTCSPDNLSGCTVPPSGPGNFYPYWSSIKHGNQCSILFGNVSGPGVNDYGKDAQYGQNMFPSFGYPEFESKPTGSVC